jgi:hypothetical protein
MQMILAIQEKSGRGSIRPQEAGEIPGAPRAYECAQYTVNVVYMTFMSFRVREGKQVTVGNLTVSCDGTAVALSWFVGTHHFLQRRKSE